MDEPKLTLKEKVVKRLKEIGADTDRVVDVVVFTSLGAIGVALCYKTMLAGKIVHSPDLVYLPAKVAEGVQAGSVWRITDPVGQVSGYSDFLVVSEPKLEAFVESNAQGVAA